jgi:tetratricopeptide (TPR) repeat protein
MVDGSGLRTGPAVEVSRLRLFTFRLLLVAAALTAATGCVYFNAFYNANKLFKRGVEDIEDGRESAGRMNLESSIEKAERIVANNPGSRWADDALRLIARARLMREEWAEAAAAAGRLMGYARSRRDSAEAAGYLGQAELNLDRPARADSLLTLALSEKWDGAWRAELLAARGRARARLGRYTAGEEDLRAALALRPKWVRPHMDLVRLLTDAGRGEAAAEALRTLLALSYSDREEREVVRTAEYVAERDTAAAIAGLVDVEASTLIPNNRAELVKLRGDLRIGRGDEPGGRADYRLTAVVAPESRMAAEAEATLILMDVRRAATVEEFDSLRARLEPVAARTAGRRSTLVRDLHETFVKMEFWISQRGLGLLLAAEAARDALGAPRLARRLFLSYADEEPEALWAPKAILAALALTPPAPLDSAAAAAAAAPDAEELRRRLLEDYHDSAYVQAVFGGEGGEFTFEELEQGLKRQLERLERLAEREVRARRAAMTRRSTGG